MPTHLLADQLVLSDSHVTMPSRARLARDILHHLSEAVLIPLVLFYIVVVGFGLDAALLVALGWSGVAVVARLASGVRPPTLLLAATGISVLKVAITYVSNSATTYFVQPTLVTFVFAAALLVSLAWKRPLIQRLADDFCPLPLHVTDSPSIRRFFRRLSVLWGAVLLVNASTTLSLLLTSGTITSVPLSAAASVPPFALGLVLSYVWFKRSLRDGGFQLSWGSPA